MKTVTLLTDFGNQDAYVGIMKGVVAHSQEPVQFIDLTHEISPQDILQGRLVLEESFRHFPPGTIHLVVIDPGVGTDRRRLVVEVEGYLFVAPDNGILSSFVSKAGAKVYAARVEEFLPANEVTTFEGRDVFAPMVRYLCDGIQPQRFADPIDDALILNFSKSEKKGSEILGEIVYIDRFGNLISNILRDEVPHKIQSIHYREKEFSALASTYAEVKEGDLCVLWNSMGRLEVACRNGSAREKLQGSVGNSIRIRI